MIDPSVLFLGVGITPHRIAGDKNFLFDLTAYLKSQGVRTHLLSIAERPSPEGDFDGAVTFLPRALHGNTGRYYHRDPSGRIVGYHHWHRPHRELLELAATLVASAPRIRAILARYPNPVVHWTDLTLAMPLVRLACGLRVRYACSMMRYVPQGMAGNVLRARSVRAADAAITATEAAKGALVRAGCRPERLFVAPWGAKGVPDPIGSEAPGRDGRTRLLWAGFIQQIQEPDFLMAVGLARRVAEQRSDVEFTFCFKPESFRESYLQLERPGVRITRGGKDFLRELGSYHALLSPVARTDTSLAPPLTWIEALSTGLPIITSRTLGVDELLTHGRSAILFGGYGDVEAWLLEEKDPASVLHSMRRYAREEFQSRYSMDIVGVNYLNIYRSLFQL